MPIYGYRCSQCGHELEVFQSMSDQPLRACPDCSGPLRKLLYPVGVHFKGSGFYTTDYRNAGAPAANGSSSSNGTPESAPGTSDKASDKTSDKTSDKAEKKPDIIGNKD